MTKSGGTRPFLPASSPNTDDPPARPSARWPRRWPLLVLALPAGVAVWSGWVGLGQMCGFGVITLLPGIADHFTINTAVTLPVGLETFATYAISAWLTPAPISATTRRFAKVSAFAALVLGALGQVAFHLLAASGRSSAPWLVVTLVATIPVVVVGAAAGLSHALGRDRERLANQVTQSVTGQVGQATENMQPPAVQPVPGAVTVGAVTAPPNRVTTQLTTVQPVTETATTNGHHLVTGHVTDVTQARPDVTELTTNPDQPHAVTTQAIPVTDFGRPVSEWVRLALSDIGSPASPADVLAWLADRSVSVQAEAVRSAVRRERSRLATAGRGAS